MRTVVLALLGVFLACGSAPAPVAPPSAATAALERALFQRVQSIRASEGLPPLREHTALSGLARAHSEAMAAGRTPLGHDGFEARSTRMQALVGPGLTAENVAFRGPQPGDEAAGIARQWLESPGHRRNMLGPYAAAGVGAARRDDGTLFATLLLAAGTGR